MSPDLQLQKAKVSVTDFKAGIDQAETEATCHATELANEEHHIHHQHLKSEAKNAVHSLAAAKTVHEFKAAHLHDHAIVVGSLVQDNERAQNSVRVSSRKHEIQVVDLNNRPPPPRPLSSTAATRTGSRTQPDTWATVASGTYHTPPPPPFDGSYLDVRVSAFRHHNEEYPLAIQDQVFDLSIAVYVALQPIRQAKAPLHLARDLASSKRSLFPPEINDDIVTLCDVVR